jgi:hypothetical protein
MKFYKNIKEDNNMINTNIIKKMGRREVKYKREDFLKEAKVYKQLLKASDKDTEIVMTGYVYLKELNLNIIDFEKLSKTLKRKPKKIKQIQTNKNIPELYFEAGLSCLELYGLNYKDINNFYYYQEVEKIFYKKDFLKYITDETFKKYYEDKFYSFDKKIDEKIKLGFINKKYTLKRFFDNFKIPYKLIKIYEDNKPDLLKTGMTGFAFKEEKNIFPFSLLKKDEIEITEDFKDIKIPDDIFKKGKECLKNFGLSYEDINYFYTLEKMRENSFKSFLKKEINDKSFINYFLDKNIK